MKIYIYDIEVFSDDWIVVFRNPEAENNHIVVHNDNSKLRAFLNQPDIVIGGFNNKWYDDWIVLTMLNGGDNQRVKEHNDFIIGGSGGGWEYPFIQFQKKPFRSFDLRDDIDKSLSLKAIEGNLGLQIVESSVPFDIDRPLTPKELEEVIYYCKNDVDATVRLYNARSEYLKSKRIVAEMYDLSPEEALGLTNAKLSARVLGAKSAELDDERDYQIPPQLDENLIPEPVLAFFMQIRDKSIPDEALYEKKLDLVYRTSGGECPVTYAWGGVHGAKSAFFAEATGNRLIVNYDVASLYPNSMINFGYCSRGMADPDAYKKLVETRLAAKKAGDKEKANALKLVVNTVYGAMLNEYNDLADRRAGRSVCISNQLAVTQLIVMLGNALETLDFININTDGLMFYIDRSEDDRAAQIVAKWCEITGFEMERDDFTKVIQKDVNNYIGVTTGGKIKSKGGYVKQYRGGDFSANSLVIVQKAIVENLLNGTPVEETINSAESIFDFQMVAKTGRTYDRSVHYIDGKPVELQKVNRIYATADERYGQVKKQKLVREKKVRGKVVKLDPPLLQEDTVAECPDHAIVDNENRLTLSDIDKSFYIDMAKKRIKDYTVPKRTKKKETEEFLIMANSKVKIDPEVMESARKTITGGDWTTKNVYQKLAEARARFLDAPIQKSGKNRFAGFKYFELEDIVPAATAIFKDLGLLFVVSFDEKSARGILYNTDAPEAEYITVQSPVKDLVTNEGTYPNGMNAVQALGGTETYLRRYLYMLILDIVDADTFDATQGKDGETDEAKPKKSNRPASPEERAEVKKELIDEGGDATEVQIKSIKNGLKKLRAKDADEYEEYVTATVKKMKKGLTKSEAEKILIEIGKKIEEAE